MTVIALNNNSSTTTLTLQGTGLPSQFQVFRTTSGQNCASAGTTGPSVSLPASSVTTLYATNYDPPTATVNRPSRSPSVRQQFAADGSTVLYTLRGRSVGTMRGKAIAPGVFFAGLRGTDTGMRREVVGVR